MASVFLCHMLLFKQIVKSQVSYDGNGAFTDVE